MPGVSCWNNASYTGTGVGYTSDTPNTSAQQDSISSCIVNTWSDITFYKDTNYGGASYRVNNASYYPLYIPDMKTVNFNDVISSIRVTDAVKPTCYDAGMAYLQRYPDIFAAGLDPWSHYIANGRSEGRYWGSDTCDMSPNACTTVYPKYKALYPDVVGNEWNHYVSTGEAQKRCWPGISCDGRAVNSDCSIYQQIVAAQIAAAAEQKRIDDAKALADSQARQRAADAAALLLSQQQALLDAKAKSDAIAAEKVASDMATSIALANANQNTPTTTQHPSSSTGATTSPVKSPTTSSAATQTKALVTPIQILIILLVVIVLVALLA